MFSVYGDRLTVKMNIRQGIAMRSFFEDLGVWKNGEP
jgi:hypothetical protein